MNKQFKVALIGDSRSGKSSLIRCLKGEEFLYETQETIGIDFYQRILDFKNINYTFKLYDTSGCEAYRQILNRILSQIDAAIICFDASQDKYQEQIANWCHLLENELRTIPTFILGNKIDIQDLSMTSDISTKYPVFYVSAKTGENVQKCFNKIFMSLTPQKHLMIKQKAKNRQSMWGLLCSCCKGE
ncbi:unnamed protein product [Paramecium pentaurelia]|uniref:Uncharacterized protein n=1 Tax=Paramecium pentaurelia TaxID=43138 RepID=A0A8S1S7C2_9CILI|nr:unnamed protein product [Paramecium pentaurelia]